MHQFGYELSVKYFISSNCTCEHVKKKKKKNTLKKKKYFSLRPEVNTVMDSVRFVVLCCVLTSVRQNYF